MFEDCNSLAELNAARVKASTCHDVMEVNAAYNKRRAEILGASLPYKRVASTAIVRQTPQLMSHLPYVGTSSCPGHIEWTENGFRA